MADPIVLVFVAISVLVNIMFIKMKFERGRNLDAIVDAILLAGVMIVFAGSFSALVVGTISSMFISIYLWFSKIKVPTQSNSNDTDSIATKITNTRFKEPGSFNW